MTKLLLDFLFALFQVLCQQHIFQHKVIVMFISLVTLGWKKDNDNSAVAPNFGKKKRIQGKALEIFCLNICQLSTQPVCNVYFWVDQTKLRAYVVQKCLFLCHCSEKKIVYAFVWQSCMVIMSTQRGKLGISGGHGFTGKTFTGQGPVFYLFSHPSFPEDHKAQVTCTSECANLCYNWTDSLQWIAKIVWQV